MTEQETPAAPAEPEKKGGGARKIIFSIVGFIVVALVIAVAKFGVREVIAFVTGDTAKAEVGDCITNSENADDMKIVDCGDASAAFKVVGVVEDKTQDAGEQGCAAFPDAEGFLFLYEGTLTASTTGRSLCLATNAK